MAEKRIIEQVASTEVYNDDWLVKDSVTQGTTKITPQKIKEWILGDVDLSAEAISYDNTSSGLEADDVQGAIDEVLNTAGKVDDVKVDGVSVVDENKVAQITTPDADGISYDNTTSGLEADDVQEAIDEVNSNTATALEAKADKDGIYEDLIAGNLLSDSYTTDNAPYIYRQSPSASAVDLSLVGGTIAWNQLVQNEYKDFTNTIIDTRSEIYFAIQNVSSPVTLIYNSRISSNTAVDALFKITSTVGSGIRIKHNGATSDLNFYSNGSQSFILNHVYIYHGKFEGTNPTEVGGVVIKNQYLIDLTQAFGSTIADAVYAMEQSTAGSGIAWLKSYGYLAKDYYAYQSGKLESVNVASRKVVGFNQWDEEWEVGGYNGTNGNVWDVADRIRSKSTNYIAIKPSTTYYNKSTASIYFFYYDKDKNYISYDAISNNIAFTTPSNAYYIRFFVNATYGTTYNNDICINISDTAKNGTYEPYTSTTYDFDSSKILRGIPKLSNGQMHYDGDVYESDGSVTRKYGVVDLGTLDWSYYNGVFYANIPGKAYKNTTKDCFCAKYVVAETNAVNVNDASTIMADKQLCGFRRSSGTSENSYIYVEDSAYTDAQAFTTAMNGVYLVYELATPTTESATPFTNPQLVGSTEEFVDAQTSASTPTRDVDVPCGQDSKYFADLKSKIENIPDVPSTNGTYTLKATRSASGVTYAWVSG